MTYALHGAYQTLDHARTLLADVAPGVLAQMEQDGAAARHALAMYGVDLDDPSHCNVAVAVLHTCLTAMDHLGHRGAIFALAQIQQALIDATRPPHPDRSDT